MEGNEQGQYLDINPYAHMLPDSNHLKPVAFSCKSLSAIECRYVNNEHELLVVLTGLIRFHYYGYSRTIHVIANHKSLVNIIQKDLAEMPARLQRIVHQIHQYDVALLLQKKKSMLWSICLSINPEYRKT